VRSILSDADPPQEDSPQADGARLAFQNSPEQLNSIPRSRDQEEQGPDRDLDWKRSTDVPRRLGDQESPVTKPGDIRSLPRDAMPKFRKMPEYGWARMPDMLPDMLMKIYPLIQLEMHIQSPETDRTKFQFRIALYNGQT
jgi:hypothetical protein